MAKTPTHSTARRREVRKAVPKRSAAAMNVVRDRRVLWAALYALLLAVAVLGINEWWGGPAQHYPAQVLDAPVVSRVAFEFENIDETRHLREQVQRNQLNIYVANEGYLNELRGRLKDLLTNRDELGLPDNARYALERYIHQDKPTAQWEQDTHAFLRAMFDIPILLPERYEVEVSLTALQRIILIHPDPHPGQSPERVSTPSDFFSLSNETLLEENIASEARYFKDKPLEKIIVRMVMLNRQPTYKFDPQITEQRKQEVIQSIAPVIQTRDADQVLVAAGIPLREEEVKLIRREREAFANAQTTVDHLLRISGSFVMLLLIASGLWVYTFAYQPKITRNAMRGLAVTVLLILAQGLAVVLSQLHPQFVYGLGTFPPLLIAIILAIVYDQRYALATGAFACIIVMASLQIEPGFALVLLAGVGTAVAMLRDVRTRSKLVRVGVWSGLAMGVTTLVMALGTRPLMIDNALMRIGWDTFYAVLAGLGTGLFVQGILPTIERVFKVTTAMTLRELNDASHPLLQRLAQEAAGTYQHSLRIADMSEAAAEAIGADGLLCRVGAMYHDIGKVNKPLYFIENQGGGPNRHTKLSPAMSLLIIVGHVKDGTEMAREYGLPHELRHFIESHHGTTLVEYFYHAARAQKEAKEKQVPSEFEFRYPGPKPQTKEAAIMLLSDSIEAAARVLSEPTAIRIEQLVDKMANKRLMDEQFDECNLTLQELHKIQQSLTKTLCAIYHTRIKYPGGEKTESAPQTQSA